MIITPYGLSPSDRVIVKIMGKQEAGTFMRKRAIHFRQWRRFQFSFEAFPIDGINELLGSEKISRKDIFQIKEEV